MANRATQQTERREEPESAEEALAPELAGLRQQRIAERAYARAESRGFAGNQHLEDWLEAEREIDAADIAAIER